MKTPIARLAAAIAHKAIRRPRRSRALVTPAAFAWQVSESFDAPWLVSLRGRV